MKRFLVILICLCGGALLIGCHSSKNLQTDEQINYSSELQQLRNSLDSLHLDVNRQSQITSDKLSNLKLENTTIYLSQPDSTGKQYPIKQSVTHLNKQEEEHTQEFETLCMAFSYLSDRVDSLSHNVNQMINKQEIVKELSWWDLHKDKVYTSAFLIIIGLIIWNKTKK